jgi:hypothetical protein
VPLWLPMGLLRVELRLVGELGRAFLAATVFVTKSDWFQPALRYTSRSSWCCHMENKTWKKAGKCDYRFFWLFWPLFHLKMALNGFGFELKKELKKLFFAILTTFSFEDSHLSKKINVMV